MPFDQGFLFGQGPSACFFLCYAGQYRFIFLFIGLHIRRSYLYHQAAFFGLGLCLRLSQFFRFKRFLKIFGGGFFRFVSIKPLTERIDAFDEFLHRRPGGANTADKR